MITIDAPQRRKKERSFQEKLALLGAELLPTLGTALGSFGGPAGAAVGGALGSAGQLGINSLFQQPTEMAAPDQPLVFGEESPDMITLPGYTDQSQYQQSPYLQQFGMGVGNQAGQLGLQGIMSLLNPQATSAQSLMGKMDTSLRDKLVRMVAMKQMLGG